MKRDQQLQKDVIAGFDKLFSNLDRIYKERFNRAKDYLDREIDLNKSAIEQQQRLAERGLTNTLAFEQAKAAKLQLERRRLQEQEIKQQKRVAFYNLLSGYAKTEPATALQRAILESTLAEVIAGNFIEGTENVERDLSGNKMHSGQDGYVIAVDGKERIFNPKQNAKIGDISNDEAAQILADYQTGKLFNYGDTVQPIIPVTKQVIDLSSTNELLMDVKKAIENIPGVNFQIDGIGNVIDERIKQGIKNRTIYKNRI
jgi:multidrug efflux pump subunit AcrA (membrane-fusion protein)